MTIQPISSLPSTSETTITELVDDTLQNIFIKVLAHSLGHLENLALVCRKWHRMTHQFNIGKAVFEHAGLPFPVNFQGSWKDAYLLSVGARFLSGEEPKIHIIEYCPNLDIRTGKIAWIEERGFIHYHERQFSLLLMDAPMDIHSCSTPHPISSLCVIQQHIVCGMSNGEVAIYSLESLKLVFSYSGHNRAVLNLFPCRRGWISTSDERVMLWDNHSKELSTLFEFVRPLMKPDFKFFNHQLFFTATERSIIKLWPSSFLYRSSFYALDLDDIQRGPIRINGPHGNHVTLRGWGDQIAFLDHENDPSITSFRIQPEHEYKGGKRVSLGSISFSAQCYFRGDVAFVVSESDIDFDPDAEELSDEEFERDVTGGDRIQLFDLRGEKKCLFERVEPSSVAMNDDGFVCTIMGNRFIFFRNDTYEIVTLDFPILTEEVAEEPTTKKQKQK